MHSHVVFMPCREPAFGLNDETTGRRHDDGAVGASTKNHKEHEAHKGNEPNINGPSGSK